MQAGSGIEKVLFLGEDEESDAIIPENLEPYQGLAIIAAPSVGVNNDHRIERLR